MTDEGTRFLAELMARVAAIEEKLVELEQAMEAFPRELLKGFEEAFEDNDWDAHKN